MSPRATCAVIFTFRFPMLEKSIRSAYTPQFSAALPRGLRGELVDLGLSRTARTPNASLSWMHFLHNGVAGPSVNRHAAVVLLQTSYAIAPNCAGLFSRRSPDPRDWTFLCRKHDREGTTFGPAAIPLTREQASAPAVGFRHYANPFGSSRAEAIH